MLPEQLSNGVCSLQEGVARFTKSVFISFDDKGRVTGQRVAATVIRSAKRLTYVEAQALIDGDLGKARENAKAEPDYPSELLDALRLSNRLAKILRERRRKDKSRARTSHWKTSEIDSNPGPEHADPWNSGIGPNGACLQPPGAELGNAGSSPGSGLTVAVQF